MVDVTESFNERNLARSRKVCRMIFNESKTGKCKLSDKERRILDMWPRFEDGEPVMIGDEVDGFGGEIIEVYIAENAAAIWNNYANHMHLRPGERVKRPVQSVLDADGVEIHEGEILQGVGRSQHLFKVIDPHHVDPELGEAFSVRCIDLDDSEECHCRPELLTHTRQDSWERLEEDARKHPLDYCLEDERIKARYESDEGGETLYQLFAFDLIRRAKALAGVEVGE